MTGIDINQAVVTLGARNELKEVKTISKENADSVIRINAVLPAEAEIYKGSGVINDRPAPTIIIKKPANEGSATSDQQATK